MAAAVGCQVLASPCSSVRDPMKPVVRLKPRDPKASNKFGPNPGSCRSAETKKTWRLPPDIPDQKDQRQTGWSSSVADARLATASIYSAAALNADALGWGATAAAAESVGMCKDGTTAMAQKQPLGKAATSFGVFFFAFCVMTDSVWYVFVLIIG